MSTNEYHQVFAKITHTHTRTNYYNSKLMCYLTGRLVSGLYADTSIPMTALWCPHSVIMANFMMPETHQPVIVIILKLSTLFTF